MLTHSILRTLLPLPAYLLHTADRRTGPLHWELLARARAADNQVYVGMCSPARDLSAGYHAWGHSMVVDPKGEVIAQTGEQEDIVYADLSTFPLQRDK